MTKSAQSRRELSSLVPIALFLCIIFFSTSASAQTVDPYLVAISDSRPFASVHFVPSPSEFHYQDIGGGPPDLKRALFVHTVDSQPSTHGALAVVERKPTPDADLTGATRDDKISRADVGLPDLQPPLFEPLPMKSRFLKDIDEAEPDGSQNGVSDKFHWKSAILQSILIQSVQHGYAVAVQEKTRRELKGPWFKDWFKSVRGLRGWDDGNKFFTNYVAHPWQGAMTGFIFLQNHDRLKKQKFSESKTYWADRLKAMAWSAAWSTQWEIGPFSQAAIGNVGLKKGMAYVDLVMTPTAGTGWMVLEEALDRYVIRHVEERTNFFMKIFLRTLLNPMRGVANALRFKPPWYRDRPFGH